MKDKEQAPFAVGRTLKATEEHPHGVPCIVEGRDSVVCEFPSQPNGLAQAIRVCDLLNAAHLDRQRKGFL